MGGINLDGAANSIIKDITIDYQKDFSLSNLGATPISKNDLPDVSELFSKFDLSGSGIKPDTSIDVMA